MRKLVPLIFLIATSLVATASAQGATHRAGLVVQYGDGSVQTACVAFAEDEISGVDLLDRSGIPAVTQSSGIGAAVCKIGRDGCDYPAEGCFCKRAGDRAVYWAYQVLKGDAWSYASLGAANVRVRDGDVNGWAWGAGDSSAGALPPVLRIGAICAAPASPTAALAPDDSGRRTPEAVASPSPAPPAAGTGSSQASSSYLAFAAIAAILIAGAIVAARRRR
ncbi:MAG: hypothetical protein WCI67_16350 [Chloroflexales bacterium]